MLLLSLGFNAMSKTVLALTPKSIEQLSETELSEYRDALELKRLESADYTSLDTAQRVRLNKLRMENPRTVFSHLNEVVLVFVVCVIVLLYTVLGGLEAAFYSDMIQGIFIIILSVILLPFAWAKINVLYGSSGLLGAFTTIHERLPESFFQVFGSPAAIDFTWYFILALSVMVAINVAVQANQMTAVGSAKDEYTARLGFTTGCYIKRIVTILWGVFALSAVVLYGDSLQNPDLMWGYATRDLLGPLDIGLVGLMVACLMAALMSTADCLMITNASLLTRNLYRPLFSLKTENHYVNVGRIIGAFVIIGTGILAVQFQTLFEQMKLIWEFHVIFAASFWMGILWRRSNRKAAWCSILITLLVFFLLPILVPMAFPGMRTFSSFSKMTESRILVRHYTANQIDVEMREKEIERWHELDALGKAQGNYPETITAGHKFEKTFLQPAKSIFWTKGMRENDEGVLEGFGRLNIDLVLLGKLGFDLSKNPNALNETIRILLRIIIPFLIIMIVGLATKPENERDMDRFYAKMKTLVLIDREADARELDRSYADPHRFDHLKMFPNSSWEMCKWDRTDIIGFSVALLAAFGVVGLFFLAVSIGG